MQPKLTKEDYRRYLEQNVNCIVKPMVVDILKHRPEKVVDYVIQWCNTRGRELERRNQSKTQRHEDLEDLDMDREIQRSLRFVEERYSDSHLPASDNSIIEDFSEDEENEKKMMQRMSKKKNAISAEAYGEYNKLGQFKPRFIDKTGEQLDRIKSTIKKSFMFNTLESHDQEIVIGAMKVQIFEKGDTVIRQGDDGDELFIVGSGTLKCYKQFEDNKQEKFLKSYEPGEVFGELALLYNAPRAASIYADRTCELYSLDRDTFNHIVKNATIQRRQKYEHFLQKIEILKELDHYERQKICDCLTTEVYKYGSYIIHEGEIGDKFYLIEEGTADALKTNAKGKEERVFEYKENEYFGELALLNGDKRKASIRVTSDKMVVASLSKDSFKRLLGSIERILERNQSKYEKYVHRDSFN